ncbi:MAG: DUF559 domain-containing protein [Mycobacterium sp.]
MNGPIIGSEAIAQGSLSRSQLRWNYRSIFRDIYIPKSMCASLEVMTVGAWLWSGRRAVVTGRAAAALHGAEWVDDSAPVELLWGNNHYPPGTIVRDERFQPDEVASVRDLTVATSVRTAFDLARHLPRTMAIAHLDALARATRITEQDVLYLVGRYSGGRGNKRARMALSLMDSGAESPKESWLRLLLIGAGFPRPATQIRVTDGHLVAYLDMGWEEPMVAVEYDGDQHRTDRERYVKDIRRAEMLDRLGWRVIKVIKEDRPNYIIERARTALARRGWVLRSRDRSDGRAAA